MKNKFSIILILTGAVLILSALFLCLYNIIEDKKSGENAAQVLDVLKKEIIVSEETTEAVLPETTDILSKKTTADYKMQEKQVENYSYIGYISIPKLDIELPVMSSWSYAGLNISPCCYSGSAADDNLIIAAHNYNSHFRKISKLNSGDEIYFTDIDGNVYSYEVSSTEIINGNDASAMYNDDDNSWDLTLFTCTLDGRNRITVRAVKADA